ncbi:MAG: hypothetical protein M0R50_08090 [Candidatus Cloacimonetes bacterium]|jgi:hypothetical protein|nr:hypothetical protein [Candidatus Cloacimonadota bacterium]
MSEQLICQYCGKAAKSKSGLTLHEKTCDKRTCDKKEEAKVNVSTPNPYSPDDREYDERDECDERDERHEKPNGKQAKASPFSIGAFLVMTDYIPILLDVDFCIALSNYILEHGSPNSAIMAFAHQLNKLDGD